MTTRITRLALLSALSSATVAAAGPITPPAGPVTPTHKTLTQVEPRIPISASTTPGTTTSMFTITQPGSYYLTENILVEADKSGIVIASPNVTLDLNGFTIQGAQGSLDGVFVHIACHNAAVRNGTIRNCGGDGLDAFEVHVLNLAVEDLRVMGCGGHGIATAQRSLVRRCHVQNSGLSGVLARAGTRVTECIAAENAQDGFRLHSISTLSDSTACFNGQWGIRGDDDVRIERCHLNTNTGGGISVANFSTVAGNSVDFHLDAHALRATGEQNTLKDNAVTRAAVGVSAAGPRNLVVRNSLKACSTPTIIAGGNVHGPFIMVQNGADLGAVPSSAHPMANTVQ